MAGDWIKIEHTMPDKPEVVSVAEALGIDQDAVVGKLIRFWVWCDQQTVDGNALRVTPAFIDRLTACPGFAAALIEIGWLRSREGRFSVPNFGRHNGQTAKSRALTSSRVKRSRNGASVTESLPEKRREEKRRSKSTDVDLPPISPQEKCAPSWPTEFCTEGFLRLWRSWRDLREATDGRPLPDASADVQAATLMRMGPVRAMAALEHSIAGNYRNIYEPGGRSAKDQAGTTSADFASLK